MSDKPTVLLEHYLKQLKLPTMLREYAAVAANCGKERLDYATFLLRLAEREVLDREQRARLRDVGEVLLLLGAEIGFGHGVAPLLEELMHGRTGKNNRRKVQSCATFSA